MLRQIIILNWLIQILVYQKKKKHLLELYDYSICPFLTLLEEVVGKEAGSGAVEPKVEEDYYKN